MKPQHVILFIEINATLKQAISHLQARNRKDKFVVFLFKIASF